MKSVHLKKLGKLGYSIIKELEPGKVLFNYSPRVLTPIEESVLSKGLKFTIPPTKLSKDTIEKPYASLQSFHIYEGEGVQLLSFMDKLRNLALSSFEKF